MRDNIICQHTFYINIPKTYLTSSVAATLLAITIPFQPTGVITTPMTTLTSTATRLISLTITFIATFNPDGKQGSSLIRWYSNRTDMIIQDNTPAGVTPVIWQAKLGM